MKKGKAKKLELKKFQISQLANIQNINGGSVGSVLGSKISCTSISFRVEECPNGGNGTQIDPIGGGFDDSIG